MIFCDNDILKIETDIEPCMRARTILPCMSKEEKKDIQKKPFICTRNVNFFIIDKRNGKEYRVLIPKGYTTDIASIPFGVRWMFGGKNNPYFIVGATVHDKLCECKWLVNYNRELSTLIFKELLINCGYNKLKANVMAFGVDQWQKLQKGWRS